MTPLCSREACGMRSLAPAYPAPEVTTHQGAGIVHAPSNTPWSKRSGRRVITKRTFAIDPKPFQLALLIGDVVSARRNGGVCRGRSANACFGATAFQAALPSPPYRARHGGFLQLGSEDDPTRTSGFVDSRIRSLGIQLLAVSNARFGTVCQPLGFG